MEILDTVIKNSIALSNAHIDWSPTAGMIWLVPTMVVMVISLVVFTVSDDRRKRREEIYRAGREAALDRHAAWDANGYQEIIVYNSNH